jgi:hypothetical protein
MPAIYLHDHPNFRDLLRIIEENTGILDGLVEKDYWIMHSADIVFIIYDL